MHRRHPYGPHPTAALNPPCKSLDNRRHRLAPGCDRPRSVLIAKVQKRPYVLIELGAQSKAGLLG